MGNYLPGGFIKFAKAHWLVLALLCAPALQAQDKTQPQTQPTPQTQAKPGTQIPFKLNGQEPGKTEINLFLSPDGQAPIYLMPTGPITKRTQYTITAIDFPVTVTLRQQENHGGVRPSLTFYLGPDTSGNYPANASSSPSTSALPSILPLTLAVDVLPRPGDQYTGSLLLTSADNYATFMWKINIKPAMGILALDMTKIDRNLTYSFWGTQSDCISVNVREKVGRVRLEGVSASLEQVIKSPGEGFDLKRNVEFFFNGQKIPDFTQSPSAQLPPSQLTSSQPLSAPSPSAPSPSTQPSPSQSPSSPSPSPSPQQPATQSNNSDQGCGSDSGQQSSQAQDPQTIRTIAANNGLATVGLRVHGLKAGEYNVVIRFQSSNSTNDDAKLILNLQVRHHWTWPLLVLIVAVVLSFVSTKVISSLRQRYDFMERIEELKPAWLDAEPKILPVVWVQAILRQSQKLSDKFWLTGENQIEKRVSHAEDMIKLLDKIRILRIDIQTSSLRKYQKYRAIAKLNGILSTIGSEFLDEAMAKEVDATLTTLRQWLDATSLPYWLNLREDIRLLVSEVRPNLDLLSEVDACPALVEKLEGIQNTNDPPQNLPDIEDSYAVMKLLWERRNLPDDIAKLKPFVSISRSSQPAGPSGGGQPEGSDSGGPPDAISLKLSKERAFMKADVEVWKRLKKENALKIKMPDVNEINPLTAYTAIEFSVAPQEDESLADTYLFRHGLQFEWEFAFTAGDPESEQSESEHEKKKQKKMILKPVTEEPQIAQYFPQKGTVTVSVKIRCQEVLIESADSQQQPNKLDKSPINLTDAAPLTIADCKDFDRLRGLAFVEVASFFIAALAAVLSGMATYYSKNSGWGSTADYLTLFIWGFGVDQTKNFIQNLQAYSK